MCAIVRLLLSLPAGPLLAAFLLPSRVPQFLLLLIRQQCLNFSSCIPHNLLTSSLLLGPIPSCGERFHFLEGVREDLIDLRGLCWSQGDS